MNTGNPHGIWYRMTTSNRIASDCWSDSAEQRLDDSTWALLLHSFASNLPGERERGESFKPFALYTTRIQLLLSRRARVTSPTVTAFGEALRRAPVKYVLAVRTRLKEKILLYGFVLRVDVP
ncbi:hypothetical protein EVAR_86378_1 [Eumeta japonica]|uniref:Uncharacterized protein n=1 Tax=Eumeta variegata TaxID=151549 RepID=A0A4C1W8S1_EUMVA|nr:hypothetical protein EVAR_86378_1 [Eumeta japonica]